MSPSEEPCCGCLPRPAAVIERGQIVQRPAQRLELDIDPLEDETSDADTPAS